MKALAVKGAVALRGQARLWGAVAAAVALSCTGATGVEIGVNAASVYMVAMAYPLLPQEVDGVVPQAHWNNIGTANNNENCATLPIANPIDSNGKPSGAGFVMRLSDGGRTIIGQGGPLTGFKLFNGGLTSHYGRSPQAVVSNITYATYDVITYIVPNAQMGARLVGTDANGPVDSDVTVTSAGSNFYAFDDATTDGVGNYIRWKGLTGTSFTLTMNKGTGDRKYFAALQIIGPAKPKGTLLIVR
jgi:hypothetical protein